VKKQPYILKKMLEMSCLEYSAFHHKVLDILLGMIVCIYMYLVSRAMHQALSFFFDTMICAFLVCGFPHLVYYSNTGECFYLSQGGLDSNTTQEGEEELQLDVCISFVVYLHIRPKLLFCKSSLWLVYTSTHLVVSPFYYLSEEYIRTFAKVSLLPMTCYYYFGFLCEFHFSTPFENYAFPGVVLSIIKNFVYAIDL
jgi:hypothetical protein